MAIHHPAVVRSVRQLRKEHNTGGIWPHSAPDCQRMYLRRLWIPDMGCLGAGGTAAFVFSKETRSGIASRVWGGAGAAGLHPPCVEGWMQDLCLYVFSAKWPRLEGRVATGEYCRFVPEWTATPRARRASFAACCYPSSEPPYRFRKGRPCRCNRGHGGDTSDTSADDHRTIADSRRQNKTPTIDNSTTCLRLLLPTSLAGSLDAYPLSGQAVGVLLPRDRPDGARLVFLEGFGARQQRSSSRIIWRHPGICKVDYPR